MDQESDAQRVGRTARAGRLPNTDARLRRRKTGVRNGTEVFAQHRDPGGSLRHSRGLQTPGTGRRLSAANDNRLGVRRTEDRQKIERISVRGLLAMLLAGFAAALAVTALWLQHGWNKRLESVHAQQTELTANLARLREDIN